MSPTQPQPQTLTPPPGLAPLEAAAEYLRDHPETRIEDAPSLAERFGLPERFLVEVLTRLRRPAPRRPWYEDALVQARAWGKEAAAQALARARRSTDRPIPFVAASGVATVLAAVLLELARRTDLVPLPEGLARVFEGIVLALFGLCLATHLACYARHCKARLPVAGAALAFPTLWAAQAAAVRPADGMQTAIYGVVALFLALLYGAAGVASAILGAWLRVQRRKHAHDGLSRQQLLDRLFALQERLRTVDPTRDHATAVEKGWSAVGLRPDYPLLAFSAGVGLGVLRVAAVATVRQVGPSVGESPLVALFVALTGLLVGGSFFLAVAYLGRGWRSAVRATLLAFAGMHIGMLVPLDPFGPGYVLSALAGPGPYLSAAALVVLASFVAAGASIQRQADRDGRPREDDPAALLAERVSLERRLQAASGETCVMSVDVAKSTRMKDGADPLVVEWTFREYQALVARASEAEGGSVLSTTGDGAVVGFAHCASALAAARRLHSELPGFNQRVNRLDSPFRLRIGLHCDQVQAALGDVQFTHAIDVAAHVQKHAPVGGILVTEPVARRLPDEALAALVETVEGLPVYLVVNPTLGA